jgi:alkylated DNA repair dioxygenase AlkB
LVVSLPPGLSYLADYVSEREAENLLLHIDAQPWITELSRRVQHYGYRYDYRARTIDRSMYLGPLPGWITPLTHRLHVDGMFPAIPDQVIANEYQPGQGIAPHVDCIPCFGPVVASLSLGSTCVMDLSLDDRSQPVRLETRSLLVLAGEARLHWRHGIRPRRSDPGNDGIRVPRGRRISLTFRTIRLADPVQ